MLREKTIALLEDLKNQETDAHVERFWAEAWNYATTATNMCVTTSNANGVTPYEMWYGKPLPLGQLHPFATVGYMPKRARDNKLEPRGDKCIMLGIFPNHPSGTLKVLNIRTRQIVDRQNVSWHPGTTATATRSQG